MLQWGFWRLPTGVAISNYSVCAALVCMAGVCWRLVLMYSDWTNPPDAGTCRANHWPVIFQCWSAVFEPQRRHLKRSTLNRLQSKRRMCVCLPYSHTFSTMPASSRLCWNVLTLTSYLLWLSNCRSCFTCHENICLFELSMQLFRVEKDGQMDGVHDVTS